MPRRTWSDTVGGIFDLNPRNGEIHKHWLPRNEEKAMMKALLHPTKHICLDGPTGTGKSSLAVTTLARAGTRYKFVRVSKSTTWSQFCRILVSRPQRKLNPKFSIEGKAGVQGGLPTFEGEVGLEIAPEKGKSAPEIAESWSVTDACRAMVKQGVSLFIDDFDRINGDLIANIADMAKELIQIPDSEHVKLIIVGTDDVYSRLINENLSLQRRISVVSLGAFPSSKRDNASWAYLVRGFDKLGIAYYPGSAALSSLGKAPGDIKQDDKNRDECIGAVYRAADGLPKSLTELGYEIAVDKPFGTTTINTGRILEKAEDMFSSKVDGVKEAYPALWRELKNNTLSQKVLAHLFVSGTGRIHSINRIVMELARELTEQETREAVEHLLSIGVVVKTGASHNSLFFSDLEVAHALSVLATNPYLCKRYNVDYGIFAPINQLMLSLGWELSG